MRMGSQVNSLNSKTVVFLWSYMVCLLCLRDLPVFNRPYKDADVVSVNILGTE
jgi:hypothetical protein